MSTTIEPNGYQEIVEAIAGALRLHDAARELGATHLTTINVQCRTDADTIARIAATFQHLPWRDVAFSGEQWIDAKLDHLVIHVHLLAEPVVTPLLAGAA